jgi:hypothetical protein
LDNFNSLLYGLPKFLIDRLQNVQNRALVRQQGAKLGSYYSINELPISQRIIYKIVLITYKSLNGLTPHYINNMFNIILVNLLDSDWLKTVPIKH